MTYKDVFDFIPWVYLVEHAPLGQYVNIYLDTLPDGSWKEHNGTIYANRQGMSNLLYKIVLAEAGVDFTHKLAIGGINYPYPDAFYQEVVMALDKYARLLTSQFMSKHWPNE